MNTSTIIYPLLFIALVYLLVSDIRKNIKYKKENMEVLLQLDSDDKIARLITSLLTAIMIGATAIFIFSIIYLKTYTIEDIAIMVVLPLMMIILYIPLSRKTRVSTLGIHKRSNIIRWEDIKLVNYLKPDSKNRVKARIVHSNFSREASIDLTFMKNDSQLEEFKEIAKKYRFNKKKGNKSGK